MIKIIYFLKVNLSKIRAGVVKREGEKRKRLVKNDQSNTGIEDEGLYKWQ